MSRMLNRESVMDKRIRTEEWGKGTVEVAEAEIDRMADQLGIDQAVVTVAKAIYRRSLKHDFIQNRTLAQVSASAVYAACRVEGEGYSPADIVEVSQSVPRAVSRTYADMSNELDLKTGPIDPKDYVPRYCSELGLSELVESKAHEFLEETSEVGVGMGNSPSGTAAAAVYCCSLLCDEKVSQREIAKVSNVSEKTIRNRYQVQIEHLGIVGSGEEPE